MPAIDTPSIILVTGASGFIGIHIAKRLVEAGFHVRGTVRSTSKGEYIKNLLGDKFHYAIVEDMTLPNAYDDAVKGVDGIAHTASLVAMRDDIHPDEFSKINTGGNLNLLESVKKYGPNVKRVIIMSSYAAVAGPNEDSWNQKAVDAVEQFGMKAPGDAKYAASKVLAERAAWDWFQKNKASVGFDLIAVCPPWVFGPMIHEGTTPASINSSMLHMLSGLDINNPRTGNDVVGQWIDVRDVAKIHDLLFRKEEAANQRFLLVAGGLTWKDIYDDLAQPPAFEGVPVSKPDDVSVTVDAPKSENLLALLGKSHEEIFRPRTETIRDGFASAKQRGWVFKVVPY